MPIPERIQSFLTTSNWKSIIQFDGQTVECKYVGRYEDMLAFESYLLQPSLLEKMTETVDFKIFLPIGFLDGKGKIHRLKSPDESSQSFRYILGIQPMKMKFTQKRRYKRFFLLKKAWFISREEKIQVMLLDLSFFGAGIASSLLIPYAKGVLRIPEYDLEFPVEKCHEGEAYGFQLYGFSISTLTEQQQQTMTEVLHGFQDLFKHFNLNLG